MELNTLDRIWFPSHMKRLQGIKTMDNLPYPGQFPEYVALHPKWTRAGSALGAPKPARELPVSGPGMGNPWSSLRKCPVYRSCLRNLQNALRPDDSQHWETQPQSLAVSWLHADLALGCGAFWTFREASARGNIWIYKLLVHLHQKGNTHEIQTSHLLLTFYIFQGIWWYKEKQVLQQHENNSSRKWRINQMKTNPAVLSNNRNLGEIQLFRLINSFRFINLNL